VKIRLGERFEAFGDGTEDRTVKAHFFERGMVPPIRAAVLLSQSPH
jgi:hypothetical protein